VGFLGVLCVVSARGRSLHQGSSTDFECVIACDHTQKLLGIEKINYERNKIIGQRRLAEGFSTFTLQKAQNHKKFGAAGCVFPANGLLN
jgi:hypothetical protein